MYGATVLDVGTEDVQETYFVVDDDDLTSMVGIKLCYRVDLSDPNEHLIGWRADINSPTSGLQSQSFGDTSALGDDRCDYIAINEELMFFTVYYDNSDIEDLVFENDKGT